MRKGILKGFDSTAYRATVQLSGSYKVYLEDIPVARNLPSAEMAPGRKVAVLFFDRNNAREALVFAVFT